jgi:hypothetical protein
MRLINHAARRRPAAPVLSGVLLALVLLGMLGIVLLTACSSDPPTAAGGGSSTSSAYAKALAYAQCIRAHGVPAYPDPNSQGQFVVPNGGTLPAVSPAVMSAAGKACQKLQPPSMPGPPQGGQGPGATSQGLKFSACMRSHGVPDFPDPAANGSFTLPPGANPESPQWQHAERACQSLMPLNPGGQQAP